MIEYVARGESKVDVEALRSIALDSDFIKQLIKSGVERAAELANADENQRHQILVELVKKQLAGSFETS